MSYLQGRRHPQTWRIPFSLAWFVTAVLESIPLLGYSISWRASRLLHRPEYWRCHAG